MVPETVENATSRAHTQNHDNRANTKVGARRGGGDTITMGDIKTHATKRGGNGIVSRHGLL